MLACFLKEEVSVGSAAELGRRDPTPPQLEKHLAVTRKLFKKLGLRRGDVVASLLAEGSDECTARTALASFEATLVPLPAGGSRQQYASELTRIQAKLLLLHPGEHPAREAAWEFEIPVALAFRHFEAGIFSLERDLPPVRTLPRTVPLVLIASGLAYSRLSARLDPDHPVIGITPPSLEELPRPHTIEHIAAECARMLRRYRPHGPYALSGCRAEALVALEMARLLEEDGERVVFVAMLDASELFCSPSWPREEIAIPPVGKKRFLPACDRPGRGASCLPAQAMVWKGSFT